jgi:hypothetical protein
MKSIQKVVDNRSEKIKKNNLNILEYDYQNDIILCKCIFCDYEIRDNHRNLTNKNFKCKYCKLIEISDLIKNNEVTIKKIIGSFLELQCKNGHLYKQDRRNFLANKKCKLCYLESITFSKEQIVSNIHKIHGEYYKYDFSNLKNLHSKITIKCSKNHIFKQKVANHLQGKGCPICRESIGERQISKFLEENNITYIRQKKFDNCKYKEKLSFDFFIPDLSIAIEYDGIQHFKPIELFGGQIEFEKSKIRDKIKNEYCLNNNIHLIRISYLDNIKEKLLHIYKLIIF